MLPFSRFGAAKPCLGQPWRPPPVRCTRGDVGRRSTGDIISHGPEAIKRHILFFAGVRGVFDGHARRLVQRVHAGIGMRPWILECGLIQGAYQRTDIGAFQQRGAWRNQQPYAVLHGIRGVDQVMPLHEIEQFEIILDRAPRRERHQRGSKRDTDRAEQAEGGSDVRSRMPLFELRQHVVAE